MNRNYCIWCFLIIIGLWQFLTIDARGRSGGGGRSSGVRSSGRGRSTSSSGQSGAYRSGGRSMSSVDSSISRGSSAFAISRSMYPSSDYGHSSSFGGFGLGLGRGLHRGSSHSFGHEHNHNKEEKLYFGSISEQPLSLFSKFADNRAVVNLGKLDEQRETTTRYTSSRVIQGN